MREALKRTNSTIVVDEQSPGCTSRQVSAYWERMIFTAKQPNKYLHSKSASPAMHGFPAFSIRISAICITDYPALSAVHNIIVTVCKTSFPKAIWAFTLVLSSCWPGRSISPSLNKNHHHEKKSLHYLPAAFCTYSIWASYYYWCGKSIVSGSVDSCAVPTPAALSALPSLGTPATNATWDLSGVAVQNTFVTYAYRAKTAGFSSATYSDSTTYNLTTSSVTSYKAWRNIKQGSGAIIIQGEEILTRQAKSIGSITGVAVDSIVFPPQVLDYNARPLRILKFPSTIGSVWVDSTARNLSFTLSVSAAGMNNVPGEQRQRRLSVDSVVGWGSMVVPIVGKTKTTPIRVLQVHHSDISVDSFFINGSAASPTVLTAIGASQGQSKTVVRTYFYRANATRPLIELIHATPSHSSSASTFYIHAVDLEEALDVAGIAPAKDPHVYPNPVAAGATVQLILPGSRSLNWQYKITNTVGQTITEGLVDLMDASGKATIAIPNRVAPSLYYLSLSQNGQTTIINPLIIK